MMAVQITLHLHLCSLPTRIYIIPKCLDPSALIQVHLFPKEYQQAADTPPLWRILTGDCSCQHVAPGNMEK